MAICQKCGASVNLVQDVCIICDSTIKHKNTPNSTVDDEGRFIWGLLGFFVPLSGLVIFLI